MLDYDSGMSRSVRVQYPGAVYHAMCRGNNGQEIFLSDKGRRLFLSTLTEDCTQTGWRIHAYVLMSNHYHILLETPQPNLVDGMRWFQGAYTQRFNAMFKRRGHLFHFENDPDAGRRGEFENQIKRGWYIGSPEFRERLSDQLSRVANKGDNYRGRQRRDHGEDEAERLLAAGLRVLGLRENEVLEMRNNRKEKQTLAWLMNAHTTVTVRWTAVRLEMGHPENASHGINRFRRKENREIAKIRKQLEKSLFSVG